MYIPADSSAGVTDLARCNNSKSAVTVGRRDTRLAKDTISERQPRKSLRHAAARVVSPPASR